MAATKKGLYANIHAKQERIAHGSGETMRKPGSKGAPSAHAFEESAKTEKGKKSSAGSHKPAASPSAKRTTSTAKKRASSSKPSSH